MPEIEETLQPVGKITSVIRAEGGVDLTLEDSSKVRIRIYQEGILRFSYDPEGVFKDDTEGKILADPAMRPFPEDKFQMDETSDRIQLRTSQVIFQVQKDPMTVEAAKPDGALYFRESSPLRFHSKKTVQTLEGAPDEYFYGGGMQNGYFSHKGRKIDVELKNSHWNAGSVSNPAPFYMSTRGYGQFRNTFQTGTYSFLDTTELCQNEKKLDIFYFFGNNLADVLSLYTQVTGRPHLIPRWGLMPGDANCYKETMDALKTIEGYEEHDFPRGWILPNDGYGCGYTDLKGFIDKANGRGFRVGLWTENSVDKIAQEVREFGSRAVKTDVAWVGPGYAFALDGVRTSFEGIEHNSPDRGYVWTCCGWAGTQRYSAIWSGDQFGNWEYIRMHIPSYLGAGLSGNPFCGSDVDGIFAGCADTQVRDLQWKCFTPILIFMSGWAPKNKQPWVWDEPYASINRKYLNLKLRLAPYMYSFARKSSLTGEPIVRPVLWEYPEGKYAFAKDTQYQFLLGDSFLVAPVFEDTDRRDAIYLPGTGERWIDYHSGEQYQGGQVLNSFYAPLEKLPVFVRSGSVIPMYPLGRFDGDCLPDETHPLTLDIYPGGNCHIQIYEDDGATQEYRGGAYAETPVSVSAPGSGGGAPGSGGGILEVVIGPAKGRYSGMKESRCYELAVHTKTIPGAVRVMDKTIEITAGREAYDACDCGCYYDKDQAGGVFYIKTPAYPVGDQVIITADAICNDPLPAVITDTILPEMPQNLHVEKAEDHKLVIAWDEAGYAAWYDLEIDGMLFTHVSNPYIHRELECTTQYTYRLRACNTLGASSWSQAVTGETLESSLRDALGEADMEKVGATSERPGYGSDKAVNGDSESFWRTMEKDDGELPAVYTMDFRESHTINRFEYKSRDKGTRGNITKYSLAVSIDGIHYKDLVTEGVWEDQDEPHTIEFQDEIAKHMRITAWEGVGGSANAVHLIPYKAPGTNTVVLGNYTGGDSVDDNDLTFVRNYMGVYRQDNDWGYVSKCDINYNGRIDAYDLAFVARQLDGAGYRDIKPDDQHKVDGAMRVELPSGPVKAGETFEVRIIGEGLENVYAFDAVLALDEQLFEHLNCTGRCKKEVVARSGDLSAGMVNASTVKSDENGAKIVVAYTKRGDAAGLSGSGELAVFTLKAKQDTAQVKMPLVDALLVGDSMDTKKLSGE